MRYFYQHQALFAYDGGLKWKRRITNMAYAAFTVVNALMGMEE
jgi:hypothetical protein